MQEGIIDLIYNHKDVSVIICCKNEGSSLKSTIDSIMEAKNSSSFEIIVVDDGSSDNCTDFLKENNFKYKDIIFVSSGNLGVSRARNLGAEYAIGTILIFCDAHIFVPNYWIDKLVHSLQEYSAQAISCGIKDMVTGNVGFGQIWNNDLVNIWLEKKSAIIYEIPIAPGGIFGIIKDIFISINGFDNNMILWGKEDEEISLRLWLFGHKVIIDTSVEIEHLFKKNNTCGITSSQLIYNYLCLIYSHFSIKNLGKAIELVYRHPSFPEVYSKIAFNRELFKQRTHYFNIRKYDEDYFFNKFNIYFNNS